MSEKHKALSRCTNGTERNGFKNGFLKGWNECEKHYGKRPKPLSKELQLKTAREYVSAGC